MPEFGLLEYYRKMCERNIILDFQGAISQDMLVGMAELIKNKFHSELGNAMLVKKIFSTFIEMAQNIAYYSAERIKLENHPSDVGAGIIVVSEDNRCYSITSGNLVATEKIPKIVNHCDKINSLNKDELKQLYKKHLRAERERGQLGGNIGLIDIVRKSGNPILYEVTPIDNINSFLVLSIKIQEEK